MEKAVVDQKKLAAEAIAAKERAYVPYSRFRVGAALLAESGNFWRSQSRGTRMIIFIRAGSAAR